MTILEIPGFAESAFQEKLVRDAAFLDLRERVNGFDIEPLTLRRYLILRLLQSPLLNDEPVSPYDLGKFLWVMSPKYKPGSNFRRMLFLRVRCRIFTRNLNALMTVAEKCRAFMRDALTDLPNGSGPFQKSYFSDVAAICYRMRATHSEVQVLDMPMAKLLQYLKLMDAEAGRMLTNPRSDRAISQWQKEQQAKCDAGRTSN